MAFLVAGIVLVLFSALLIVFYKNTFYSKESADRLSKNEELTYDVKKYSFVSLHKNKAMFFFSGLFVTMLFVGVIIEYPTFELKFKEIAKSAVDFSDEIIDMPITELPPPPPPKVTTPEIVEVPDEEIIEELVLDIEPDDEPVVAEPIVEFFEPVEEEINEILDLHNVQQHPEFSGGNFTSYILKSFNVPSVDREMGTSGKIFVQFVVEKDGTLGDIKVVRGLTDTMNQEAIRVVKTSPKWKPGKNGGVAVRVRYVVPITIKLD